MPKYSAWMKGIWVMALSVEVFYVVFGYPGTLFQNDHYQGFVVNMKDEA